MRKCLALLTGGLLACNAPDRRAPAVATTANGTTAASSTGDVTWSVRADRVGPVTVGMTAAEARQVLRLPAGGATGGDCSYLDGAGRTRLHANVMLSNDTVVRFDVLDSAMATAEGAKVGDSEDRIRQLYAGRVAEQPHKYLPGGHYLIVAAPGDTADRIVFETDGKVVTKYRAGRRPEVEYVEGCG